MDKKLKKAIIALIAIIVIGLGIFLFMKGPGEGTQTEDHQQEQTTIISSVTEMPQADGTTSELLEGFVLEQNFTTELDSIDEVAIVFTRIYNLEGKASKSTLKVELLCDKEILAEETFKDNDIPDQHRVYVKPKKPISGIANKELTLKIYDNSKHDTGVALMINSSATNSQYVIDGDEYPGTICFNISGK